MAKNKRNRRVVTFIVISLVLMPFVCFLGCRSLRVSLMATFRTPRWDGPKAIIRNPNELEQYPVVLRYAPILRQLVYSDSKLNFPLAVDFDGDQDSSNNRQNLYDSSCEGRLKATVYYSVVETSTHYFITYLVYHACDRWEKGLAKVTHYLRMGGSHENDGENIQLVIRKGEEGRSGTVELVACQHHNDTDFFGQPGCFGEPIGTLRADDFQSNRPVFHLEPGKHGIYMQKMPSHEGAHTITFSPSSTNSGETWASEKTAFDYELKPILKTFWEPYVKGKHLGNSGIMDGAFSVNLSRGDARVLSYPAVPRFFNSDEWSVLFFKKDAGIMPFFFGQGRLFFDPAWNYHARFQPRGEWSVDYTYNPYLIHRKSSN